MWSYFSVRDYYPHHHYHHCHHHYRNYHQSIFHCHQWTKSIFCLKTIFIVITFITTCMANYISSSTSGSTGFHLQDSLKSYNFTSNLTITSNASSLPFHQPFSYHNLTTPSTLNNFLTSNNLFAPSSASNFTTSAHSSPFSTPYDAVQWSSKQVVASGPVFIGDSIAHSAAVASSSANLSNFSGSNLTLPHW